MQKSDWDILERFGITPEKHKTLTRVDVWNCPGLTALPDLPNATDVYVRDCPGLTALPDLPNATDVYVWNCPGLTALPDLPNATRVDVGNFPGLTTLPDLPNATEVYVWNCPGLTALHTDERGYCLYRANNRYHAGCRSFTAAEAIAHWGGDAYPDKQRGAAFVAAVMAEEERIATCNT